MYLVTSIVCVMSSVLQIQTLKFYLVMLFTTIDILTRYCYRTQKCVWGSGGGGVSFMTWSQWVSNDNEFHRIK